MKKLPSESSISSSVMSQIQRGEIRMKPRVYYVLLGVLSLGVVLFSGVIMSYLASSIFFWLRIQTADTMAYGARANLREIMTQFPWWMVVLAVILLFAAVILVRRQGRLYRHKPQVIAIILILISGIIGFVLSLFNVGQSHVPGQFHERGYGPGWHQRL